MDIPYEYKERYNWLKKWASEWNMDINFTGVEVSDPKFPLSLHEWYKTFGYDSEIYEQDRILKPEQLEDDGFLKVFFVENQGVVTWGYDTRTNSDDPTVYVISDDKATREQKEANSISEFCFQRIFYMVPFCQETLLWGWADETIQNWLFERYNVFEFGTLKWPGCPSYLLGDRDTVIWVDERPASYVNIAAKNEGELYKIRDELSILGFKNEKE